MIKLGPRGAIVHTEWCDNRGEVTDHHIHKRSDNGKEVLRCWPCQYQSQLRWRAKHPAALKATNKRYEKKHEQKRKKYLRNWYRKNRDAVLADKRDYYAENRSRILAYKRMTYRRASA